MSALNSILFIGILRAWVIIIVIFDLTLLLLDGQVLPGVGLLLWLIDIMLKAFLILFFALIVHGFVMMIVPCLLFSRLIRRFSVTSVLFDAWLVCLQVLVELLVELSSWMGSSCTISARGMALVF